MKEQLKKTSAYIFAQLIWLLTAIGAGMQNNLADNRFSFLLGIFIAVVCMTVIKDEILGWIVGVAVVVLVNIQNLPYLIFALPFVFLAAAYKEIIRQYYSEEKKSKKDKSKSDKKAKQKTSLFTILSVCLGAFMCIYSVIALQDVVRKERYTDFWHTEYIVFFALLILLCVLTWNENQKITKKNKKELSPLVCFYAVAILMYAISIFYCYSNFGGLEMHAKILTYPWFSLFTVILYNNDPILLSLLEKAEVKITKLAEGSGKEE